MQKPLGCLSRNGLIAALLTLLAVVGMVLVWGGTIFSPGPLNAQAGEVRLGGVYSHAETAGHCDACHPAPWEQQGMDDRCLACHSGVGRQLQDPASLHAALQAEGDSLTCRACHPDHRGAEAPLTVVDADRFPHEATGYSLQGHQQTAAGDAFACADCHGPDLAPFEPVACAACHRDLDAAYLQLHAEAFGPDCLACHDGLDTYGGGFDHNQAAFPLQGKHAPLPCLDCHPAARTIADLQGAPQDCFSCHQAHDAHAGQFGQDCDVCHTAEDWEQAAIDHNLTAFPLTGQHAAVECQACHVDNVFQGAPQDCFACHQADDAHEGQFGPDCAACHNAEDWEQATFDHALSAFPLLGKHAAVKCQQCHVGNVFQGAPQACSACHDDPARHRGLFGADCAACHTTAAWIPARFDLAHTFPINHGERGPSPCQTCHPDNLQTYTCYTCHEHGPAGIESEHREEGITDTLTGTGLQDCVSCHPTGQEEEGEGGERGSGEGEDDDD